jgi:hypothetical protein
LSGVPSPGQEVVEGRNQIYTYGVYGISLSSEIPLSLPRHSHSGLAEVELRVGSPATFTEAIRGADLQCRSDGYHYAHLEDRSSYVRWTGLGEFLVSSDGQRIIFTRAMDAAMESFQVYLLGQALAFALVKRGFEPLHATAIAVGEEAVVVLGASGFGKSSLAACFLAAGHALLTDDLLLVQPAAGGLQAYPGPPRIKLFPGVGRLFLGRATCGVPMNPNTGKLVIPLEQRQAFSRPLPLRGIYALAPPCEARRTRHIRIEPLPRRDAFMALVRNTFNYVIVDAHRLHRQVDQAVRVVETVSVKHVRYPRGLGFLPSIREAILSDLHKSPRAPGDPVF